jgi:restriction system protein
MTGEKQQLMMLRTRRFALAVNNHHLPTERAAILTRMRKGDRLFDQLLDLPWWISLCVAALVFVVATYVLPAVMPTGKTASSVADQLSRTGWIFSFPFLVAAAASGVRQRLRKRILEQQKNLDSIRELSWQEFEALVGEAFRRQGYSVTQHGGTAPDGGIDLVILKAGAKAVVQCKRWRERHIGEAPVRELYGVMTAEGANEAIFVTCGQYTGEARRFADGKPIRLVNGEMLLDIVRSVQQA